ncbi:MAG: SH2 domain-containing protein [Simkaniaceae bacterium]|nr:SH2 domain-containing protein [Candidatus Sacchlamyda saccharinae]
MATFMNFDTHKGPESCSEKFNLDATLSNNAWHPNVNSCQAEQILANQPTYTYLLRPNIDARSFSISFVQKNGKVIHDNFTLIDPLYGIWRNGMCHHVGKLEKVICDMMECSPFDLRPL